MNTPPVLRAVPVDDRAWLLAALADALDRRTPILPVAEGAAPESVAALQREDLPEGTAVVIRTSGSSGVPKAVALSAEALRASAEATHEALGGPGQWLVALPGHLISGLQMLVRSIVSGIDPVFVAPAGASGGFDPDGFLAAAQRMDGPRRYVSLVPVQLARLLDRAEADLAAAETLRAFDAVLVGGQAVTLDLRRRAHEFGVELRRSYGMTETAGGCVYDGVEIGDTLVRVRGGEVQLAGSSLALGYVGDPELTAERFIEEESLGGVRTRWYRTGDAGELLGGMLTVTGRLDRVVISGGVNVSLDEVERVVREFPGWGTAVALGMSDPEWGERPALAVEIEEGATGFDAVRDAVKKRLGAAAAPLWATETERLPRLAGGKPDLRAIEEWLLRLRSSFREVGARGRHGVVEPGPVGALSAVASHGGRHGRRDDEEKQQ